MLIFVVCSLCHCPMSPPHLLLQHAVCCPTYCTSYMVRPTVDDNQTERPGVNDWMCFIFFRLQQLLREKVSGEEA